MSEEAKPEFVRLEAIHEAFTKETDRAAAIVAGALLDDALANLIRAFLVEPVSSGNSLVDGDRAPLGPFSARINAAHQMGLISEHFANDLHLIRKIRNEFAHHPFDLSFDSPPIRDRVAELERRSEFNARHPRARAGLGPPGARGDFLAIASWMLFNLSVELEKVTRIEPIKVEFGYIDWSKAPEWVWDDVPPEVREALKKA